jgi:hypothetical protein
VFIMPDSLPWLAQATELHDLAGTAMERMWTGDEALRALKALAATSSLMFTSAPPEPIPPEPEPIPPEPVEPQPIPPSSNDKYPKEPPKGGPATVHKVPEDYPNVMAALDAAKPGDTVSVADGVKLGELTITKSFDPTKPVVLRARNIGKAELDKRVRLKGQGLWLHGFKSTFKVADKADGSIVADADYLNITKLEVQSPHGITCFSSQKRRGINIGWCLFNGQNPPGNGVSNIYFDLPTSGYGPNASELPRNIHIYRCDFDDSAQRPPGPHEDHCIYFGPTKPKGNDRLAMEDVEIYQCLIRSSNERVRGIYMKRGCQIIQNTLAGKGYNWGIRHGGDSVIEANTATGSYKLVINGRNTRILNNLCKQLQLYAGCSKDGKLAYQAADGAFLDTNTGPLLIGFMAHPLDQAEGGKVGNVTVCNHTGAVTINDAGTDRSTFRQRDKSEGTYLPRLTLTPADVGLAG